MTQWPNDSMVQFPSSRWGLVELRPAEPQLPDGFGELGNVHRLVKVAVGSQPVTLRDVTFLARRGEHNHRDHPSMRVGLDPPQHFEAVHFRHFQVEENQLQAVFAAAVRIGARAEDEVERLGPVAYY